MKFYLYDFCKDCYINEFQDEEDLINWLVMTTRKTYTWNATYEAVNEYLENINITGKDAYNAAFYGEEAKLRLRPYMFVREDLHSIDARKYWNEVLRRWNIKQEQIYRRTHIAEDAQYGDKYTKYSWKGENAVFFFRASSVPGIRRHKGYGRYYRSIHTYNEMKLNTDPEYGKYSRPARRDLPTAWDDIPRNSYKSWKHCTKKRKQWM